MSIWKRFLGWLAKRRLQRRLAVALPRRAARPPRRWLRRGPTVPMAVRLLQDRDTEATED